MGIQVNDTSLQNGVINNLYTKVQGYTSQFLNTDTRDFGKYLKENFDSVNFLFCSVLSCFYII